MNDKATCNKCGRELMLIKMGTMGYTYIVCPKCQVYRKIEDWKI